MPVNESLATFSDWTFGAAVVVYLLAMVFYLIEQTSTKARAAAVEVPAMAGAPAPPEDKPAEPEPTRSRADRFGRMAVSLTLLGAAVHLASIVLRGAATERVPWGNMYEYMSAVCFTAVVTWMVLARKYPIRRLTGFVLLPVVILMFLAGTVLYTNAAPVQPSLQSYWLVIHVSAAAASSGLLLVPGVASILYLIRDRYEVDSSRFTRLGERLPAADVLDRVAYRTTIIAFPVFTFGVICGAIWAEAAWGRFWGWDPKETTAFVAWVVYAAYLHSRATAGWRGNRAAVINIVGFAVTVFNLFFVNLVTAGLHSYAGVG
jgi:cytochrome c-type biogenesis protein CcsB